MKIYGHREVGSPRRLAIYLEEKGIEIPFEPVDLLQGAHRKPEFLARNPAGFVPVLELEDGVCIAETLAIARYLEELYPEPAFMGRNAVQRAHFEMWQRVVEFGFYSQVRAFVRQTSAFAKVLEPVQVPEWGELNKVYAEESLRMLDRRLEDNVYIAGGDFSWADITVATAIEGAAHSDFEIPMDCEHVTRWFDLVSGRPSFLATRAG